jgi:hypothetical protein
VVFQEEEWSRFRPAVTSIHRPRPKAPSELLKTRFRNRTFSYRGKHVSTDPDNAKQRRLAIAGSLVYTARQEAAIDDQRFSGHEGRRVGSEVDRSTDQLFRFAKAPHRCAHE